MWDGKERRSTPRDKPSVNRILIVDDEYNWSELLKLRLSNTARVIDTAGSIKECYEKLSINVYNFIIMDNLLPDGKGFDEVAGIKKRYPESYIILLTAHRRDDRIVSNMMVNKLVVTVIDKLSDIGLLQNILELKNDLSMLKGSL